MRSFRRQCAIGLFSTALATIGAASARADDEAITLDFVRHGEAGDMSTINTQIPGPDLTETGEQQAQTVAAALAHNGIDELWASTMVRSQETAAPLADALDLPIHPLAGLNEINAGIFEGIPVNVGTLPLGGALYLLAPALWTLGLTSVPELGSTDANGIVFDNRVSDAIQTIDSATVAGDTDAVFSHEGTIAIWTLMNVDNPDFALVLDDLATTGELLPYTGQVVVSGEPGDWTLVSWDGQSVPLDPGLPTELFVDFRTLIEAPQTAFYDIDQALQTGNSAIIEAAVSSGWSEISSAAAQFPVAVLDDVAKALS